MKTPLPSEFDVELRLVDPERNARRVYGMTMCRTLFGEPCLRIQWGRIGSRVRERSETFRDDESLERRRAQLLALRQQHGYQPTARGPVAAAEAAPQPDPARLPVAAPSRVPSVVRARAIERDIVQAHGLDLHERAVQQMVDRWHQATSALARYLEERTPEHFDLVDVSTLAAMYVDALAS